MTTDQCDRVWQVEALEDGRLEPKDRASFQRHSQSCAACFGELARFRELQQIMLEAPAADRTDLERRRARIALLGEANRRVVERRAPLQRARMWALVAAVAVLALGAIAAAQLFSRALPGFEVVNVAQADWHADKVGTTSRVSLSAGVASFHVEHVAAGARFLVLLPDGEIEVRGTRFVVDVASNHTRSVLVTEGVVALRLGATEQLLHAGDRWQRAPDAVSLQASGSHAHELPPAPPAAAEQQRPLARAVEERQALTPAVVSSRAVHPIAAIASPTSLVPPAGSAVPAVASAGSRFAEAVAAFGAGDYGRADSLFSAFGRDFASDSRAEDAAFLRADARARRGDKAGAAAAARAYLRTYPNGLRHPEAERLAEGH